MVGQEFGNIDALFDLFSMSVGLNDSLNDFAIFQPTQHKPTLVASSTTVYISLAIVVVVTSLSSARQQTTHTADPMA
jgi:hypothetical protein